MKEIIIVFCVLTGSIMSTSIIAGIISNDWRTGLEVFLMVFGYILGVVAITGALLKLLQAFGII